jgi:hypothetical protein
VRGSIAQILNLCIAHFVFAAFGLVPIGQSSHVESNKALSATAKKVEEVPFLQHVNPCEPCLAPMSSIWDCVQVILPGAGWTMDASAEAMGYINRASCMTFATPSRAWLVTLRADDVGSI